MRWDEEVIVGSIRRDVGWDNPLRAGRTFLLSKVSGLTSFAVAHPYFPPGKVGNQKTEASTNFACLIEELHVEMYWKYIYSNTCQSKKN
jgi:hypothetical protein